MTFGVVLVGTYTSIFIAAPILISALAKAGAAIKQFNLNVNTVRRNQL